MANVLHDKDINIEILKDKTIAVIGYGSQGKAQALCMRDSGLKVIIGSRQGKSFDKAKEDNFEVYPIEEAAKKADIVHILLPDEVQPELYKKIKKYLKNKTLSFSHGFNIVYKKIKPLNNIDIIMIAPHGPATGLRKKFLDNSGVPCSVAVKQDISGKARETALALAKSLGSAKAAVLECTFEHETHTDLFSEQTILCGGLIELIKASFETLVGADYPPEIAYICCLYELKLVVDAVNENGIEGLYKIASNTAEYGGRTRGNKIITKQSRKNMKKLLKDIESGRFARELAREHKKGFPVLNKLREEDAKHPIEAIGKEIRALFKK